MRIAIAGNGNRASPGGSVGIDTGNGERMDQAR